MLQLINDVLESCQDRGRKDELNPETFSLEKALERLLPSSKAMPHKSNISIITEVSPDIGPVRSIQKNSKASLIHLLFQRD